MEFETITESIIDINKVRDNLENILEDEPVALSIGELTGLASSSNDLLKSQVVLNTLRGGRVQDGEIARPKRGLEHLGIVQEEINEILELYPYVRDAVNMKWGKPIFRKSFYRQNIPAYRRKPWNTLVATGGEEKISRRIAIEARKKKKITPKLVGLAEKYVLNLDYEFDERTINRAYLTGSLIRPDRIFFYYEDKGVAASELSVLFDNSDKDSYIMDKAIQLSKEYDKKYKVSIVAKPELNLLRNAPKYSRRLDNVIKRQN